MQRLLDAGATLIGKTITDEVSLGILGENPFDGTPLNPKAPDRVPGGSSSGSASAVAQGLCDTALGTDTGGSVRVPASFCGLYGIRPTHGRLDLSGMMAQAPSSDTTGWFARDAADVRARVGGDARRTDPHHAADAARRRGRRLRLRGCGDGRRAAAAGAPPAALVGEVRDDLLAPPGLSVWSRAQRTLQPYEAWLTFKEWIDRDNPRCSSTWPAGSRCRDDPESERQWAALMRERRAPASRGCCRRARSSACRRRRFRRRGRDCRSPTLGPLRARITVLTAHGGLTGVPQVSIPGAHRRRAAGGAVDRRCPRQ